MKLFSLFKRVFSGQKDTFLREGEALLPIIRRGRRQEIERLLWEVRSRLKGLRQILKERQPVTPLALRLYFAALLEDTRNLMNHFVAVADPPSLLPQRLEELEARIEKLLVEERSEPPLVVSLSKLDLEDRPWVGEEVALLSEIKNTLGLPVPEALVFTTRGWEICAEEGFLEKEGAESTEGHHRVALPYKLRAELREALRTYGGGEGRVLLHPASQATEGLSLEAQAQEEALAKAYLALLARALKAKLSPQSILVWKKRPTTLSGELYTSAPDQPASALLVLKGEAHYFPKGPPFMTFPQAGLSREEGVALAVSGFKVEHYFGFPLRLRWIRTPSGEILFLGAQALREVPPRRPEPQELLAGGVAVFHGLVSGKVIFPGKNHPPGAILVVPAGEAPAPSLLKGAKGMLVEGGRPADFLGMACQRLKIPALFQVRGARDLPEGTLVTLDTYQRKVYQGGGLKEPLFLPFQGRGLSAAKGYRLLRRMARFLFSGGTASLSLEALIELVEKEIKQGGDRRNFTPFISR